MPMPGTTRQHTAAGSSGSTPASKRTRARKSSLRDETPARSLSPGERDKQQDRITRKRIQNRISQQSIREKQLAHQRQLESLKSIIETSVAAGSGSDASSEMSILSNHLNLLEENRELREALLRMRKKLLSMSSAAAAIADDGIFEQLLQKKPKKSAQESDGAVENKAAEGLELPSRIPPNQKESNGAEVEARQTPLDLDGMVFSPARHVEDERQSRTSSSCSTISLPVLPPSDSRRDLLSSHSSNYWEK